MDKGDAPSSAHISFMPKKQMDDIHMPLGHSASQKINLKGSLTATPGGKGEKRDVMSPVPSKPVIEKKTREG